MQAYHATSRKVQAGRQASWLAGWLVPAGSLAGLLAVCEGDCKLIEHGVHRHGLLQDWGYKCSEFSMPSWAWSSPYPAGLGALHAWLGSELSMPGWARSSPHLAGLGALHAQWQWHVVVWTRMSVRLMTCGIVMITNSVTFEID